MDDLICQLYESAWHCNDRAALAQLLEMPSAQARALYALILFRGSASCPQNEMAAEKMMRQIIEVIQTQALSHYNALCQYVIGCIHYYGLATAVHHVDAARWFKAAADQGHADAQRMMGECYYYGNGVTKNFPEALRWCRLSAEQNNVGAQYMIGDCYYYGIGVAQNCEEAVRWFRLSADRGNAGAQYNLSNCYEMGYGVPKNSSEALSWCKKAADQGHAPAKVAMKRLRR